MSPVADQRPSYSAKMKQDALLRTLLSSPTCCAGIADDGAIRAKEFLNGIAGGEGIVSALVGPVCAVDWRCGRNDVVDIAP